MPAAVSMRNPLFRPASILLVMLSLSIGWGIRGNFGHEFGAMLPGALAGIAACLASGREDWRARVPYFGLFGALGWAFGGSIAYMPPVAYSHTGHLPTQIYGYFGVFLIGFLWAGLGGAGTAYAAIESRENLERITRPLLWILVLWTFQYFLEDPMIALYTSIVHATEAGTSDFRHAQPFYWLDSEWLEAIFALLALCLYDLWDRRGKGIAWLVLFIFAGGILGFCLQFVGDAVGLVALWKRFFVIPQGDLNAINPATGQAFQISDLITNWPVLFSDLERYMGLMLGAMLGAAVYFWKWGQWRNGALLLLYLTLGSMAVFLIGPVLLTPFFMSVGGFRFTPPRGDSWANTAGVFLAVLVYARRRNMPALSMSALAAGFCGGLGFMVAQFIKQLCWMPGNPAITQSSEVMANWAHWRSANWHSIGAEQLAGFFYGGAIVIVAGLLASRLPKQEDESDGKKAPLVFATFFLLNILVFVNMVKNMPDWTREQVGGFRAVPLTMKAPLFDSIQMSSTGWFVLMFALYSLMMLILLCFHTQRPIAVIPTSWLGKGQMIYLILLVSMIIGNFEKALVSFTENRIATEGVVMVNAMLATILLLAFVRPDGIMEPCEREQDYKRLTRRFLAYGFACLLLLVIVFTGIMQSVYRGQNDGFGGGNLRFGEKADWRVKPLLKNVMHR